MTIPVIESTEPKLHSENIQQALRQVIDHCRQDIDRVEDARFRALLETSAEVLGGLETAFRHYNEGSEKAWAGTVRRR